MLQPLLSMPEATGSIPSTICGLLYIFEVAMQQVCSKRAKLSDSWFGTANAWVTLGLIIQPSGRWLHFKTENATESGYLCDLKDFCDALRYKEKFWGGGGEEMQK